MLGGPGPADELSAVIEFPRQGGGCHYAGAPEVHTHHPPAHTLLPWAETHFLLGGGLRGGVFSRQPQTKTLAPCRGTWAGPFTKDVFSEASTCDKELLSGVRGAGEEGGAAFCKRTKSGSEMRRCDHAEGIRSSTAVPRFSHAWWNSTPTGRIQGSWILSRDPAPCFSSGRSHLSGPAAFPSLKWISSPIKGSFMEPLIAFVGSLERRLRGRLIGKRLLHRVYEGKFFSALN